MYTLISLQAKHYAHPSRLFIHSSVGFLRYAPWESLGAGSCVEKIRTGVGLKRFQGKWLRQNTVDRRWGVNHRIHVWYAISLHLIILVDFYGTVNNNWIYCTIYGSYGLCMIWFAGWNISDQEPTFFVCKNCQEKAKESDALSWIHALRCNGQGEKKSKPPPKV